MNLSEIEKALEKMTPGPWEVPESLLGIPNTTVFGESGQVVYFQTRHLNEALGICLLRNETSKLIAALRAVVEFDTWDYIAQLMILNGACGHDFEGATCDDCFTAVDRQCRAGVEHIRRVITLAGIDLTEGR